MQRALAASVRCYGLAAPGALRARCTATSVAAASRAGAWPALRPNRAAPTSGAARLGVSRRAVRVARAAISTDAPLATDAAAPAGKLVGASTGPTFQDDPASPAVLEQPGCALWLPHNTEVGAGTMNPATFLRALGPEP